MVLHAECARLTQKWTPPAMRQNQQPNRQTLRIGSPSVRKREA
jgi:hypothetical protein